MHVREVGQARIGDGLQHILSAWQNMDGSGEVAPRGEYEMNSEGDEAVDQREVVAGSARRGAPRVLFRESDGR